MRRATIMVNDFNLESDPVYQEYKLEVEEKKREVGKNLQHAKTLLKEDLSIQKTKFVKELEIRKRKQQAKKICRNILVEIYEVKRVVREMELEQERERLAFELSISKIEDENPQMDRTAETKEILAEFSKEEREPVMFHMKTESCLEWTKTKLKPRE